jgi:hypothetical protein
LWNGDPQKIKDRLLCIGQMGCSNSISPHINKDIGFFLKEYKGINKDNKLGDLCPWGPNPDRSMLFINMIGFLKEKFN